MSNGLPDKIKISVNSREIEASPGKTILEVVHEKGLDHIPTLCHSPELEPYGSCFLCVVEVEGRWNLLPACATRIAAGMKIQTRSDRVVAARKTALELLLSNHFADCVAPCREGCPAGVDAQGYIALSAMGQYRKAVDLIRETNPLPAICGRVCVRKCEVVCRRGDVDKPVGINAVKRFVSDTPGIYEAAPQCSPPTGKSVGIVGAGPAGLTAAWFLGRKGHKVVIYEAQTRSGGMLRYGIPAYRLPDEVIDAEVDYILRTGGEIVYNTRVGKDITLDGLMKKHGAVFVASGAWAGKPMRVEGEFETEGVVSGAEFLKQSVDNREPVSGTVVIVGGGNTAMDAARTLWRLGADKVIVLYRRTKAEMPADEMEIDDCLDEGIEIMELAAPVGIVASGGRLKALRCIRMKLGEPDDSGRRRPVPLEGSEFDLPCQMAVAAIGQDPVVDGLTSVDDKPVSLSKWNTFVVDTETMKTSVEGIFAGGDAADDGPTVVIDAIRDGRRAAAAVHSYLTDEEPPAKPFIVRKEFWSKPGKAELGDISESPRHEVRTIDVEARRGNFDEVATGFEYEDNRHECDRCLSCGCIRFDDCELRLYAEEYGVDMNRLKGYVRKHKVDDRHPYVVYDPNKCILCARCIRTCERLLAIPALGLVGRGFRTEMRPALNDPLVETSCTSCGNCVEACPTGALTVKYAFPGRAPLHTDDVSSHCALCSLACPITVKRFGEGRYYIASSGKPGDYLCRYGRFGYELFVKRKRIREAAIRRGSERYRPDLCEAEQLIVSEMKRVRDKYGPEKVGVFVSPELTNEELYLAGLIARDGLKTNNVASLSIMGTGKEAGALDKSFGYTASTADRSSIREADLIICNNTALEADHQVLAVDVIQAVKGGAKLIVANSALGKIDRLISTVAMDPMRGTAAVLWNCIIQVLFEAPGQAGIDQAAEASGVEPKAIRKAADIVKQAKRVVFIHSPDRPQDRSAGDMETLANFVVLLRSTGVHADILLPRIIANSAALEIMGADPAFEAGRIPSRQDLGGARSHEELRSLLKSGEIRAALIIGEDPMAWGRTGAWFENVEFLAAMDWTNTETTQYADVILPSSTYLETEGTRCNFEGRLMEFATATRPPAGISGREVLEELAVEFGIEVGSDLTTRIRTEVESNLGPLTCFYWNTGQQRVSRDKARVVPTETGVRTISIQPPLTHAEKYKKEIREVGTERFRVRT
ncbi:MAG: FAD-dependent oxidoreductase [Candidatus Eisenbacteria bacterium]